MRTERPAPLHTRVSDLLGVDYPIVQAPMGYIARSALASAVSNSGALGIIETSSGRYDEVRQEMVQMRELTDRPWGVNIAQMLVGDDDIVAFVAGQGVRFVTTSAGDPSRYTKALHDEGITVFHVVPSRRAAAKAVAAGVDGPVDPGLGDGSAGDPASDERSLTGRLEHKNNIGLRRSPGNGHGRVRVKKVQSFAEAQPNLGSSFQDRDVGVGDQRSRGLGNVDLAAVLGVGGS